MRKLYSPIKSEIAKASKGMSIEHNVIMRVIDNTTGKVVQQHEGHNAATNSLLTGIGHYLIGDGIYNQAYDMLSRYVPRYISLGTMGLINQNEDSDGLPSGIGTEDDTLDTSELMRFVHYVSSCPGYGADGYDENINMGRIFLGLGPKFEDRENEFTTNCELISDSYPRNEISFRDIVPESQSEIPKTIDVIFSAMISTGALAQFRESDKDYIFITEAGLWSRRTYSEGGDNGLLAGYRIVPPNQENWKMGEYNKDTGEYSDSEECINNRNILKQSILKVKRNQVVQVIWKIQLGALDQLGGMLALYPQYESKLIWNDWDD